MKTTTFVLKSALFLFIKATTTRVKWIKVAPLVVKLASELMRSAFHFGFVTSFPLTVFCVSLNYPFSAAAAAATVLLMQSNKPRTSKGDVSAVVMVAAGR